MSRAVDAIETLACGCRFWTSGEQFYYVPCAPDCEHYRYALAETARQGKTMYFRSTVDGRPL